MRLPTGKANDMANDMARMEAQDQGGRGGKGTRKASGSENSREGVNVTATMHAEHGKGKGKKK